MSLSLSYSAPSAIPTPSQQGGGLLPVPSALNMSGSLPDLSSLHLPSAQSTCLEMDPLGQAPCLASSSSSDHLSGGLTHPGLKADDAFHLPGIIQSIRFNYFIYDKTLYAEHICYKTYMLSSSLANLYASVANLYASVSNLYASVANLHASVAILYASVANLYASVASLYASVANFLDVCSSAHVN